MNPGEKFDLLAKILENSISVIGFIVNLERDIPAFDLVARLVNDSERTVTDSLQQFVLSDALSGAQTFRHFILSQLSP